MSCLANKKNYNSFFKQIKEQHFFLFKKGIDVPRNRTALEMEDIFDLIWNYIEKADVFVSYIAIYKKNGMLGYDLELVLEHIDPKTPSTRFENLQKTIDVNENWLISQKKYVSVKTKVIHTRELYCMHIKLSRGV